MFDLDKFKTGQLATTRGGSVAKFVAYVEESCAQKLIALVDGDILTYSNDGRFYDAPASTSRFDLIAMKPRTAELWVNRYPDGSVAAYESELEADRWSAFHKRIGGKALRIEIPMED